MPRRPDLPCAACGKLMWRGTGVLPEGQATCRECRAAAVAHGSRRMYRERGCRCDECRAYNARQMREYAARRRDRDGVSMWIKYKPPRQTPIRPCAACGEPVTGKATSNEPMHNDCRPPRFWGNSIQISKRDRLAIYERDGWECQLCGDPVDPNLDPQDRMGATLDHIAPRSLTLFPDDSPENLRLAHRACNSARGIRAA